MARRVLLPAVALVLCLPLSRVAPEAIGASAAVELQNPRQKQILVTVIADAKGPIQDLSVTDFELMEDNASREVAGAVLAADPLSVALLVDTSQPAISASIPTITRDLRQSLATFVETIHAAYPESRISYSEFGGAAVTKVHFTTSPVVIERAVRRLYPDSRGTAVLLEALIDAGARIAQMPLRGARS